MPITKTSRNPAAPFIVCLSTCGSDFNPVTVFMSVEFQYLPALPPLPPPFRRGIVKNRTSKHVEMLPCWSRRVKPTTSKGRTDTLHSQFQTGGSGRRADLQWKEKNSARCARSGSLLSYVGFVSRRNIVGKLLRNEDETSQQVLLTKNCLTS